MKIIFITYNLAFIKNWIAKLAPFLKGCQISIFHIGTLQNQEPYILEGIDYYDLSSMNYTQIEQIITELSPDICVHFNFRSVYELLFYRICKIKKIYNIYLEHGYISQNTIHFKTGKAKKNILRTLHRQFNFLKKYYGLITQTKDETQILFKFLVKNELKILSFNRCLVYSNREKNLLEKILSPENKYDIVGYPIFQDEKQKNNIPQFMGHHHGILYVHQPFILDGFASISYEQEKSFLLDLSKSLEEKYGKFTVLLHPRENLSKYQDRFKDTNIQIIQSPNNYTIFIDKSLVIGHYSTALLYSLYFDIPTIITNYPTATIDPIFKDCFIYTDNIKNIIDKDIVINNTKKNYFAGPINTYQHIAEVLLTCKPKDFL